VGAAPIVEHVMQRLLVCAGLGTLIIAAGPGFVPPALAHAYLRRAVPAVGSTVSMPPTEVDCTFTEELEPKFTTIEVQDVSGKRVDSGNMHLSPQDAKQLIIGVGHLGPGTYKVIWHAVSVDTHHTQGTFTFTVAP
jgi:methionine-rich copper-binding protein CopC